MPISRRPAKVSWANTSALTDVPVKRGGSGGLTTCIDGIRVYYETQGEGKDLLLLHGWGSSGAAFGWIMRQFSGRYRVTALDFPGFGQSDMPPIPWGVSDYADFVERFMQAMDIRNPVLVGHSFGGRVIIYLTGSGRVSPPKIVLMDSAGIKPKPTLKGRARRMGFKTVKRVLTLPGLRNKTDNLMDKARRRFGSADYNNAPPVLRQTLVRVVNEDLSHLLPRIACPALLIWGDQDMDTPLSDGRRMEQLIPDAGLCVIGGAGHFAFAQRPYEVGRILDSFL